VILENHLHMVVQSNNLQKSMASFKKFTAVELLKLLHKENVTTLLEQLAFYKKAHRKEKTSLVPIVPDGNADPKVNRT
jgi:putative transposase